jgi:cystinosin
MPQVLANYRNGSTHGWSIHGILLDFFGGVLSLAQLGIDSYLQRDWSGITGNPVKLALGNISIFFDVVFMLQHYILYPGAGEKGELEYEPLLAGESGGIA